MFYAFSLVTHDVILIFNPWDSVRHSSRVKFTLTENGLYTLSVIRKTTSNFGTTARNFRTTTSNFGTTTSNFETTTSNFETTTSNFETTTSNF